jgi:hypothetical protein
MLNHNFYKGRSGKSSPAGKSQTGRVGRVIKVLTDINDPDCKNPSMINGVYYRDLTINQSEDFADTLQFAYQSSTTFKKLPLPGELVKLEKSSGKGSATTPGSKGTYWTDIVNVWNHPHHGALPDTKQEDWQANLLGGIEEIKTINPLQPNPGDILVEGRLGQSIRIGGYGTHPQIIGDTEKPIIVIRNGQIVTDNGIDYIYEDINKDSNSLYFVSNHKINLIPANTKRATYNSPPVNSDQYKGNQVVVNGGRLYFNAKEESILLSAKESIGLNAKTVNLDGQEYMCLDADKIFLGSRARTAPDSTKQPAILGKQFEFWMTQLLDSLSIVANSMSRASAVGAGPVTQLNATGPVLKASVDSLKRQLRRIQSRKVFIE